MIKTKDGYGKLIGTTYLGSSNLVLLSNGGNLEYSSSNKANTLVLRNSNLQVYASYFNSAISDEPLTDIGSVYVRNTSDTFIRRVSKSQFYSIINEKFVTIDTILTITGNKTFTTQINSSLSTNTPLEGNKGKTIINSIASAGSYVMLFKGNSANGYFTHGVYLDKYLLQYTAKTTVDENTNEVTKSATLLDESGNSSFPGNLIVSGTVSGNILESRVTTGTKPLNITSTTLVNNLNVDFLRGYIPIGVSGNVIRKRGYSIGINSPSWSRLAKYSAPNTEVLTDVAFLIHSSFNSKYAVLHIRSRSGYYLEALLYNSYGIDKSKIRVYHNDDKSEIELYYYAGESYSVIIAELLYSTGRTGSWDNNVIMYEGDTSSPSYSNYIVPELTTLQNNAETATKLLNPRYLWGQLFDGTNNVSGNMTNVGLINDSIRIEGGFDKATIRGNGHGIIFGGGNGYAHCTYAFRPEWGSQSETQCNLIIQNASAATSNPSYITTHEFVNDGTAYHRTRVRVARTDGEGTGIYTNTIHASDWFRSEGNSGWYSETWGGGWYMDDSTQIKAYNNKNVYTNGSFKSGSSSFGGGAIELHSLIPYIDFHYNNSTADYTGRMAMYDANYITCEGCSFRVNKNILASGDIEINGTGVFTTSNNAILRKRGNTHTDVLGWYWNGTYGDHLLFTIPGTNDQSKKLYLSSNKGLYFTGIIEATLDIYGRCFEANYGSNSGELNINLSSFYDKATPVIPNDGYRYLLGWQDNCPQGYTTGYAIGSYRVNTNWGSMLFEVCNYEGSRSRLTQMELRGKDNTLWFSGNIQASGKFIGNLLGTVDNAYSLVTNYIGERQFNPQTYFSGNVGLKVAMTGAGGISSWWSDTLWIKGYNGGDVKGVCSLHFSKEAPRFSISYLNSDSSSYGTPYEVLTTYNFGWASPIKWAVYLFEISSTRLVYTKFAGNTDFVSSKYSGTSTSITVYINSSYPVDETMIIGVGNSNYNVANNPMYACIRKDIAGKRITVIGGDDSSLNEGTIYVYFLYFG